MHLRELGAPVPFHRDRGILLDDPVLQCLDRTLFDRVDTLEDDVGGGLNRVQSLLWLSLQAFHA